MARDPIPTWCFALVVVRKGDQFLVVHERKHGQGWYLPAGRVEPGESFAEAAIRETLEEASIAIVLDGVIRIEHSPYADGARMRVLFTAHPADHRPPKSEPDEESLGAAWVTLAELENLPLRGDEVRDLFEYVATGRAVYPLAVLGAEGAPI